MILVQHPIHSPRHFHRHLAVLMILTGWVFLHAEQDLPPSATGQLTKFTIPERNGDGVLIWQLAGDRAKIRPDGKMEIEKLMVYTYRGTNVDWTISTPACILDRQTREAVGDTDVHICNKKTEITGMGFHWLANESRLIIRNDVRVTIHGGLTNEKIL